MPMPRPITRFNRAVLNRVLAPAARYVPAFGVIVHRGRKSGRTYRTPVNIFRQPDGYVIALTYGVGDWVRNVLAAGECTLETKGRTYRMTRPRLVHDEQRRAVPAVLRFVGAVGNVSDFVYLSFQRRPSATRSTRVPWWVPYFNPFARILLAAGVRVGSDVLLTVRGRKSGVPRSTPVTLCENAGRRGLISPFGEVDWARNLRAAGRATISVGRRKEEVSAVELGPAEAAGFIRDVVAPQARRNPLGAWFVRNVDKIDVDDPVHAVQGRPIFELHPDAK
jgi:deazaflavin-dependent oxidoreductase (nitroreductase family)